MPNQTDPYGCNAVLIPSIQQINQNNTLTLHILRVINEESFKEITRQIETGLTLPFDIPVNFNGDYEAFDRSRRKYFERFNYDQSTEQAYSHIRSNLPPNVTSAWTECIRLHTEQHGLFAYAPFSDAEKVVVKLVWKPPVGVDKPAIVDYEQSSVSGAKKRGDWPASKPFARGHRLPEGNTEITFGRLPGQAFVLSLTLKVGSGSYAKTVQVDKFTETTPTMVDGKPVYELASEKDSEGRLLYDYHDITLPPVSGEVEVGIVVTVDQLEMGYVTLTLETLEGSPPIHIPATRNDKLGIVQAGKIGHVRLSADQSYKWRLKYDDSGARFIHLIYEVWSPRMPDDRRLMFRNSP